MRSDGQMYSRNKVAPPPLITAMPDTLYCEHDKDLGCEKPLHKPLRVDSEELLIIGLIVLIATDKCKNDVPLLLALLYVLFLK